jgi:hypothetical protein
LRYERTVLASATESRVSEGASTEEPVDAVCRRTSRSISVLTR